MRVILISHFQMPFRFNAQSVFLTYPQCPMAMAEALETLQALHEVEDYCISREKHKDGHYHLHAFVKWQNKINTVNERHFDLTKEGVTYHPNITKPRSFKNVINYVKKDGEFICSDTLEELMTNKSWRQIMAVAKSTKEFMNLVLETYPKDYCLSYDRLKSMAEQHFKCQESLSPALSTPGTMIVPAQVDTWYSDNVTNFEEVYKLPLAGATENPLDCEAKRDNKCEANYRGRTLKTLNAGRN